MARLQYFGTTLTDAGHYLYELDGGFHRSLLDISSLPFNPEGLPYKGNRMNCPNGTVQYYQFCGFTILAIAGSCKDTRPGSKTIFFIDELIEYDAMRDKVAYNTVASKIISQIPFQINWL